MPVYCARYVLPSPRLLSASPLSCLPGESSRGSQSYMSRRLQVCPPGGHWGYLSTASCFCSSTLSVLMVPFLYCSCSSFCFFKTPESSYTNCPSAVCDNTSTTLQLDQEAKIACTHIPQGCKGTVRMPWTCRASPQADRRHTPVHAACGNKRSEHTMLAGCSRMQQLACCIVQCQICWPIRRSTKKRVRDW